MLTMLMQIQTVEQERAARRLKSLPSFAVDRSSSSQRKTASSNNKSATLSRRVHSGKCKASVWCLSVCLSDLVMPLRRLTIVEL